MEFINAKDLFVACSRTSQISLNISIFRLRAFCFHAQGYDCICLISKFQSREYDALEFHEKPDLKTAQKYLTKNNFFWNSGIFIWNVSTIVNAFRVYQPTISQMFEEMLPLYGTEKEQERINEIYTICEDISIDYAIMEKAEEVFAVKYE